MTINTIKVRPTVTNGEMVFNPNSIVEPSSCALRHAVDQIKAYLLGDVNEVADALNTLYEQLKSEAPEEKQDGELVFVLSYDRNNPMFNGPSFTYASGEVKEDQCPEGVKFIDDGHGGLHGVNIAFRNILA